MTHQLSLTGGFDQDVDQRVDEIRTLQERAKTLYRQWRNRFGQDTPVAIDEGWHKLYLAMDAVQDADRSQDLIAAGRTRLNEAEWFLEQTANSDS